MGKEEGNINGMRDKKNRHGASYLIGEVAVLRMILPLYIYGEWRSGKWKLKAVYLN